MTLRHLFEPTDNTRLAHLSGAYDADWRAIKAASVLGGVPGIAYSHFTSADGVRQPRVARIVEAYDAAQLGKVRST